MKKVNYKELLENAKEEYERICEKLDNMNDQAFQLEQDMRFYKHQMTKTSDREKEEDKDEK